MSTPLPPLQLNPTSRDWLIVEDWAKKQLSDHRTRLEGFAIDDRTAHSVRGRIAQLLELLQLAQPPRKLTRDE